MAITVGDRIPEATLKTMGAKGPEAIDTATLFGGKKVVLFAVPGAFTPTCSAAHLPGYVAQAETMKAKGVDTIVCLSVNDAFVMGAWGKNQNAEHLIMLADGNADFTKAMGLEMDGTGFGMGIRCKRMAMIIDKGVVTHFAIEPPGGIVVSAADAILKLL